MTKKMNAIKKQLKSVIYTQISSTRSISINFPIRLWRLSRQLSGFTKSPENVNYISMSNLIFFEFTTLCALCNQFDIVLCLLNGDEALGKCHQTIADASRAHAHVRIPIDFLWPFQDVNDNVTHFSFGLGNFGILCIFWIRICASTIFERTGSHMDRV